MPDTRRSVIVPIADRPHHRAHIAPVARLLGIDAEHMAPPHRGPRRRGADRQSTAICRRPDVAASGGLS